MKKFTAIVIAIALLLPIVTRSAFASSNISTLPATSTSPSPYEIFRQENKDSSPTDFVWETFKGLSPSHKNFDLYKERLGQNYISIWPRDFYDTIAKFTGCDRTYSEQLLWSQLLVMYTTNYDFILSNLPVTLEDLDLLWTIVSDVWDLTDLTDYLVYLNEAPTRADYVDFLRLVLEVNNLIPCYDDIIVNEPFSDVSPEHFAYVSIGQMRNMGIIKGTGSNQFAPDKEITREEVVIITANLIEWLALR